MGSKVGNVAVFSTADFGILVACLGVFLEEPRMMFGGVTEKDRRWPDGAL